MARVSNSIPGHDAAGISCRPVQHGEIEAALRLILATPAGLGADAQVLDFLAYCVERKIDTNGIWVAVHQGRIVWSMLPVVNPGRTMMIFTPMVLFTQTPPGTIAMVCDAVAEHYAQRGVHLAQILIDPENRAIVGAYREAAFDELAELVYLQRSLRYRRMELPALPPGCSLQTYSPQTHEQFADIIRRSYEQSQDCPALNGMRDMNDVIAGHQATGEFDPALWWILCRDNQPLATLLLSRVSQGSAMELVYLGIVPEARGHGFGDLLMQQALATAFAEGRENLSLAVDSRNQPALRLYYRHGLRRIGSRIAMIRELRVGWALPTEPTAGDVHPAKNS
jgi:mycothiol synthase